MARPKDVETREIREHVVEGEALTKEQLARCWLNAITGGDVRGYAESIRERYEAARQRRALEAAGGRGNDG